jgi:hypothetical protein
MKKQISVIAAMGMVCSASAWAGPEGVYAITSQSPMGEMESTLTINEDGTGSVEGMMGKSEFADATIDGDSFNFGMTVHSPMGEMEMTYEGMVDGGKVSGHITNPMGGSDFSGARK